MLSSKDGVFDKARGRMVGSQDLPDQAIHQRPAAAAAVQQFGNVSQEGA